MYRLHSFSRFDIYLWPQGQIYRCLSCLRVRSVISVCFDTSIPYLVHDMALCSGHSFFDLWHSHTLFGTWVYHHGTICRVHSWPLYDLDLNIKITFSQWLCSLTNRHTKFWHTGVSPWGNMLYTFLTFVWPWPLTYMWVAGCILSEFYSQFLSCFSLTVRTFSSLLSRSIRFCHLTYNIKCNLLFITVSRVLFLISCIMKQSNSFPVTEWTVACFNHLCDIQAFIEQHSPDFKVVNKLLS